MPAGEDRVDGSEGAIALRDLGTAALRRGDAEEAAMLLPEDHPDIATTLTSLADCHQSQGDHEQAASLHEQALAMRRRLLPGDHLDIASSLTSLAQDHHSQGEDDQALFQAMLPGTATSPHTPSTPASEAFLRSRGLDPGEGTDKDLLDPSAVDLAAEEGHEGRERGLGRGTSAPEGGLIPPEGAREDLSG
jgi:tetratricopeptide (TPR) repeat protein